MINNFFSPIKALPSGVSNLMKGGLHKLASLEPSAVMKGSLVYGISALAGAIFAELLARGIESEDISFGESISKKVTIGVVGSLSVALIALKIFSSITVPVCAIVLLTSMTIRLVFIVDAEADDIDDYADDYADDCKILNSITKSYDYMKEKI
jgi:hypothetical protein